MILSTVILIYWISVLVIYGPISAESYSKKINVAHGDAFEVTIATNRQQVYKNIMTYRHSFAEIRLGEPLLYVNSLDNLGVAINQGSFANAYHVETGPHWQIIIRKVSKTD